MQSIWLTFQTIKFFQLQLNWNLFILFTVCWAYGDVGAYCKLTSGEERTQQSHMWQTPGYHTAPTVCWGVGHVQAIHFAQLWPGTLTGFWNVLWHFVQVIQSGLAGKEHGGLSVGTGEGMEMDRWKHGMREKQYTVEPWDERVEFECCQRKWSSQSFKSMAEPKHST